MPIGLRVFWPVEWRLRSRPWLALTCSLRMRASHWLAPCGSSGGSRPFLRLTWSHDAPVRDAPDTLKARLADALACNGFDALEGRLRDAQQQAFAAFRKYVK